MKERERVREISCLCPITTIPRQTHAIILLARTLASKRMVGLGWAGSLAGWWPNASGNSSGRKLHIRTGRIYIFMNLYMNIGTVDYCSMDGVRSQLGLEQLCLTLHRLTACRFLHQRSSHSMDFNSIPNLSFSTGLYLRNFIFLEFC